ncbi:MULTISPECIES: hypothetical protein [Bacillus cereus group]|nr:hypothetical protein [Bacillus mycoides]MEC2943473.1 hypothetical protein [Bacillus cereus]MEC3174623.1 hypothetical protein [Bacillus cereus]
MELYFVLFIAGVLIIKWILEDEQLRSLLSNVFELPFVIAGIN